jgi:hypothetical protein
MAGKTIFEGAEAAEAQAAALEALEEIAGSRASDLQHHVVLEPAAFIELAKATVAKNQAGRNESED